MFLPDHVKSLAQPTLSLGRRATLGWGACRLEVSVLFEKKIRGVLTGKGGRTL